MEHTSKISKVRFIFSLTLISVVLLSIQSCNMDDMTMQPKGDYISGFAMFVDTIYLQSGGHYGIALYNNNPAPFSYQPVCIDTIYCNNTNNEYYYRLKWGGSGSYYLGVVWVNNNGNIPLVLGSYGCDTCHTCTLNKVIAFPNFTGFSYNIRCWNDTLH